MTSLKTAAKETTVPRVSAITGVDCMAKKKNVLGKRVHLFVINYPRICVNAEVEEFN